MARWYDSKPRLGEHLEAFKTRTSPKKDELVTGILTIVKRDAPGILDKLAFEFPLDISNRRWYDDDPYLWLIFNGLEHADQELLAKVEAYLEEYGLLSCV